MIIPALSYCFRHPQRSSDDDFAARIIGQFSCARHGDLLESKRDRRTGFRHCLNSREGSGKRALPHLFAIVCRLFLVQYSEKRVINMPQSAKILTDRPTFP